MVTKVTRDVLDLDIREIIDGIKITGNCGANFSMDGVPIGLGIPCDGTFVNLGATNVTITGVASGGSFGGITPIGGVIMFNGAFATIPANWQLCDGTNGTPDMTNQFVYGTNTEGELLDAGGSADAVIVEHNHTMDNSGNHNHSVTAARSIGGFTDNGGAPDQRVTQQTFNSGSDGNHSHTINNTGVAGTDLNIPPHIKLAFIQRMS